MNELYYREVVAALIWRNDRFLICRRPPHKSNALLWEFVGGKVELGESLQAALKRECREELAVEIGVGDVFCDVYHEYPDIKIHLTLFHAVLLEGEPMLLEHSEIKWITPKEVADYTFCPADDDIISRITACYLKEET